MADKASHAGRAPRGPTTGGMDWPVRVHGSRAAAQSACMDTRACQASCARVQKWAVANTVRSNGHLVQARTAAHTRA